MTPRPGCTPTTPASILYRDLLSSYDSFLDRTEFPAKAGPIIALCRIVRHTMSLAGRFAAADDLDQVAKEMG